MLGPMILSSVPEFTRLHNQSNSDIRERVKIKNEAEEIQILKMKQKENILKNCKETN